MNRPTRTLTLAAVLAIIAGTVAPNYAGEPGTPLDKEKLRARYDECLDTMKKQAGLEISQCVAEVKDELTSIKLELKDVAKQRRRYLRRGTGSIVERRRKRQELAVRKKVLLAKGRFLASYVKKKTRGLNQRSSIVRSLLAGEFNELNNRLANGGSVTGTEATTAFQACLKGTTCPDCKGTGKKECAACKGAGEKTRLVKCADCDGTGETENPGDPNGAPILCKRCKGEGSAMTDVTCVACFGEGHRECDTCFGKGTVVTKKKTKEKAEEE